MVEPEDDLPLIYPRPGEIFLVFYRTTTQTRGQPSAD